MVFTKEQLRAYGVANKESLNAKRRERRKLAKLNKPLASRKATPFRSFSLEIESNFEEINLNIRLGKGL